MKKCCRESRRRVCRTNNKKGRLTGLLRNCFLKHFIEGMVQEKRRIIRSPVQPPDDVKKNKR